MIHVLESSLYITAIANGSVSLSLRATSWAAIDLAIWTVPPHRTGIVNYAQILLEVSTLFQSPSNIHGIIIRVVNAKR